MPILIDGYNLLHASGVLGGRGGGGSLHRSRRALLNVLAASLDPGELERTTVVFDAAGAPPGLPRSLRHHGILVRYASDHADADTLIEELIAHHSHPRRLVVVSSDHRLQRAARRRRAKPVDSDRWYAQLMQDRATEVPSAEAATPKPQDPLTEEEIDYWLRRFDALETDDRVESAEPFPPGYCDKLADD